MPTIDTDKLIKEYWITVKEKYPNFEFEQFERICKAPFWFFKTQIESDNPPIIHIKWLGKIRIYPSYIKRLIFKNDYQKARGSVSEEDYNRMNEEYQLRLKQAQEYEDSKGNKKTN